MQDLTSFIVYLNALLGDLMIVRDFFPRPAELVFQEEGGKVLIALSKRSVEFFLR